MVCGIRADVRGLVLAFAEKIVGSSLTVAFA